MSFIKDRRACFWMLVCGLWVFDMLLIFLWTKGESSSTSDILLPPSLRHFFGTDQFGRDMLIRSIHGFIYSFFIAFLISVLTFLIGNLLGVLIGYFSGIADAVYRMSLNFLMSMPTMIVFLTVISLLGRGLMPVFLILVLSNIIFKARMARNETMVMKNSDYILNLRILGASHYQIILYHLLPHIWRLSLPLFAITLGNTVISVSGFSFLGFGVQPPRADIGLLMRDALRFTRQAPWLMVFPGLLQFVVIFSFNRLGESFQALLDRRTKKI